MKVGYQARVRSHRHLRQLRVARAAVPFGNSNGRGVPEPDHAAHHAVAAGQSHALRRVLRAGSVDAQPADAAGRAPLRARVELLPRGHERPAGGQPLRRPALTLPVGEGCRRDTTTSPRVWVWPTTCSATAGRRSRRTCRSTSSRRPTTASTSPPTRRRRSRRPPTAAWTDNGNFTPDCDLEQPAAQDNRATGGDFCGAPDQRELLRSSAQTHGPSARRRPSIRRSSSGWGVRPYDWQFSGVGAAADRCRACRWSSVTAAARGATPPGTGPTHRQPRGHGGGLRHLHDDGADASATCRTPVRRSRSR